MCGLGLSPADTLRAAADTVQIVALAGAAATGVAAG